PAPPIRASSQGRRPRLGSDKHRRHGRCRRAGGVVPGPLPAAAAAAGEAVGVAGERGSSAGITRRELGGSQGLGPRVGQGRRGAPRAAAGGRGSR
ncbi:unnamed protein product, partial [Ectocarpus sp. 12 AP-2014]